MTDSDENDALEEYSKRLGVVLQMARKAARITQKVAAKSMGMSPAAFGRWEAGKHKISAFDLHRLIGLYGFDPDLAVRPPASKVVIRRRLGPVADAARQAAQDALAEDLGPAAANGGDTE